MNNIAGLQTFFYLLVGVFVYSFLHSLHLFDMVAILIVHICDVAVRASHPLQKNDFSR
jgi:hypothetical protein